MKKYKVIVAHPYKQHSFELAEGLRRNNYLFKYITTVYYKKYNFTYFFSMFLNKKNKEKSKMRVDSRIEKYVVQKTELTGLIKLLIMKKKYLKKYYTKFKYFSTDVFSKKVAKYLDKIDYDALVVYDDTSYLLSKIVKEKHPNIKIILDMSAPNMIYLSEIYKNDMIIQPNYSNKLLNERKNALDSSILNRLNKEVQYADYYIVASEFSKKSLEFSGINEDKIYLCKYGVDFKLFSPLKEFKELKRYDKIKSVFIGGTKEYKGISYLLDSYIELKDILELTVIGDCYDDIKNNDAFKDVNFTGVISHDEVSKILRNSDLMIFPSLGDGFGLSVTEALASGVPVICSKNAGASDVIVDGVNGFSVDAQSSKQIVEKVSLLYKDKKLLNDMKRKSRESIKKYTWEEYYKNIGIIFDDILKK